MDSSKILGKGLTMAVMVMLLAHTAVAAEAESKEQQADKDRAVEVQLEYLEGRWFARRDIDLYNLHVYRQYKKVKDVSLHYGLSVTRPLGKTTDDDIARDSEAVGLGPSYMMRWEKNLSKKWSASIDGAGSILAYNHAHPANGRAFGFLWRIGPRVTYHFTASDSVSAAYLVHHASNGFKTHNPGYNGGGLSLGYRHAF
ncbi:acyloxyacyl hydrolase [Selenomonas sp.]|uniref:acyloxyacyl hydrolase n=1 Tax=Selenomonas sp. TaxID=2053611 RepID=UPI0025F09668|nr:acyloxyacyl hydrolase [Selenomonas sp.]